jgi:hypothetical protein
LMNIYSLFFNKQIHYQLIAFFMENSREGLYCIQTLMAKSYSKHTRTEE